LLLLHALSELRHVCVPVALLDGGVIVVIAGTWVGDTIPFFRVAIGLRLHHSRSRRLFRICIQGTLCGRCWNIQREGQQTTS
jgi:hypothetical protein